MVRPQKLVAGKRMDIKHNTSDSWCEQGGNTSINEVSTTVITLSKSYMDTNYIAFVSQGTLGTAGDTEMGIGIQKTDRNKVTLFVHYINPNTTVACWNTNGYI